MEALNFKKEPTQKDYLELWTGYNTMIEYCSGVEMENDSLQQMKNQADVAVDHYIKYVQQREDVIKEKEREIERLNKIIHNMQNVEA